MVRVAIVEDHPVVREGLKRMISDNDLSVVAEAADGEEALRILKVHPCDVVLLDISIPKLSGVEVLKRIRAEHHALPVLILSVHPEEEYGPRMLRAGAAGYLTKEGASTFTLVAAIRKVARGRRYVSPTLAERLAFGLETGAGEKLAHEILSDREYQVMRMLASGKTVGGIAVELSLSVKTISTYRMRVLEKLHFTNNAELIRYAIKQEIDGSVCVVPPEPNLEAETRRRSA